MDVSVTIEVTREYRLEALEAPSGRRVLGETVSVSFDVQVSASVWWEIEGGWGRSGAWVVDGLTATLPDGEEIELTPAEQSEAEALLRLEAEAEADE